MSKAADVNKKIAAAVTEGYEKIESSVVDGYKKIEDGVVNGYRKVEDRFIDTFLAEDGETTEEARARLIRNAQQHGGDRK